VTNTVTVRHYWSFLENRITLFWVIFSIWASNNILYHQSNRKKKKWLILFLSIIILPLIVFKYSAFFASIANDLFAALDISYKIPVPNWVLPVGISFFTFQAMAYCIDAYNKKISPERNLGRLTLFLAFFPKLMAGPIERGKNLLPQLKKSNNIDSEVFVSGGWLILWGFFKKIVIADRLAIYVDMIFSQPGAYTGWSLILGAYFFTFQIYCDFSGYTDIARGISRLLGIDLMENFRFPYFATSIQSFWRRWHISLTSWFRDYLYYPLGGNRTTAGRWTTNIMIVFLLSGLWHGAAWTFIFWGGLHGICYLADVKTMRYRDAICEAIGFRGIPLALWRGFVTFNIVAVGWIFFRAGSLADALYYIGHLGVRLDVPLAWGPSQFGTALSMLLLIVFIFIEVGLYLAQKHQFELRTRVPFAVSCPAACLLVITIFLTGASRSDFIYLHF